MNGAGGMAPGFGAGGSGGAGGSYIPPEPDLEFTLFLLMRNDLESMNPGKACAQAHHAGTQVAIKDFRTWDVKHQNWFGKWQQQAGGFGTVICLAVDERRMRKAMETAKKIDLPHGIIHDPTYPLRDGASFHLIPLDTCAYVFGPKIPAQSCCYGLDLHP